MLEIILLVIFLIVLIFAFVVIWLPLLEKIEIEVKLLIYFILDLVNQMYAIFYTSKRGSSNKFYL